MWSASLCSLPDLTWSSSLPIAIPSFFFFNDTPTTQIYTLSLHDALPIFCSAPSDLYCSLPAPMLRTCCWLALRAGDRKSTRLNSSHPSISYAVFCLKKKTFQLQLHGDLTEQSKHPVVCARVADVQRGRRV